MPRGGSRKNAGRKRKLIADVGAVLPSAVPDKNAAALLIEALHAPASKSDSAELLGWRVMWDAADLRIRLDVRKYLYDKRDGKPVQTINHLHDKPIEMNVNVKLSEIIREVRERKLEYERAGKKAGR